MLRAYLALSAVAFAWLGTVEAAQAQHERPYEFDGTHFAVSIERFMGIDYTDYEGPSDGELTARLLLNAREPAPTNLARFGFDVFIERLSLGVAGGIATGITGEDIAILAPRVGYLVGLTPDLGLWLRGGFFFAAGDVDYLGVSAEALFAWFPYSFLAFHFGPTLDVGFAQDDAPFDYVSIGIPEVGMTAFF